MTKFVTALMAVCFGAAAQQAPSVPDAEERTRSLWNEKFLEKRPAAKKASSPATASAAKPGPAAKPSPQEVPDEIGDALVGITVWRLRESRAGDDKEIRISARDGGEEFTPERIEADTLLAEGQRVRVSIETARTGYLYVIDREQYSDGTFGAPYLIFPTLRTQGGKNDVMAGRLVEIPDNPPYFTMRMSRPDQTAEMLTVLVTPKPLPDVKIRRDALKLTQEQVYGWEKQWGAKVKRLEARGQAGQTYTRAEKQAGMERTRLLTHEEPVPQTMYHCETKPGEPLLVSVPLRIKR